MKPKGVEKIDVFKENRISQFTPTFNLIITLVTLTSTIVSIYTALTATLVDSRTENIYIRLKALESQQRLVYEMLITHLRKSNDH